MNMKLKRGMAVLVPVFGIAVAGAVGAQAVIQSEVTVDPALVMEPEGSEVLVIDGNAAPQPAEGEAIELSAPAAEAAPELVVIERSTYVASAPVRVERELVRASLPPTVSIRSGQGSGEEIATRTSPIDERASLVPEYQVDHSPGL